LHKLASCVLQPPANNWQRLRQANKVVHQTLAGLDNTAGTQQQQQQQDLQTVLGQQMLLDTPQWGTK
jgi:hypothetical protein